jgi:hypothetical protein
MKGDVIGRPQTNRLGPAAFGISQLQTPPVPSRAASPSYPTTIRKKNLSKPPKRLRRWPYALLLLAVAIVAAPASAWYYEQHQSAPFSPAIVREANFPLYYPKGITIDKASIQLSANRSLLSYTLRSNGYLIYVTAQPRPASLDFTNFNQQISSQTQSLTANGTATVGIFGGRKVGSLVANDSWVFLSAISSTPSDEITNVLKHLVPVNK